MADKTDGFIIYLGAYDAEEDAKADLDAFSMLFHEKFLGDYEAALFSKDVDGKVKVHDTVATERAWGAKAGAVTGGVIGLLFPPAILGMAVAGAGVGAVAGNIMKGLKRKDIMEMGEMLDAGTYGVVLVATTTVEEGAERLMKRAAKVMKKEVDAQADELKAAIDASVDF